MLVRVSRPGKGLRTAIVFGAIFAVQIVIGLLLGSSFFSDQAQAAPRAVATPPTNLFLDRAPVAASMSATTSDEVRAVEVTDGLAEGSSDVAVKQIIASNETLSAENESIESAVGRSADVAVTVAHAARAELQSILVANSPVSVFPVVGGGPFSSSFGAPRPGGRSHQGNDIISEKMTPVVAVAAGTVSGAPDASGEGCCYVKLRHDDGSHSVYIHLNNDTPGTDDGQGWGLAEGIMVGAHVEAGAVIGYVGDSGNAEDTTPHLHFEYHPPGSDAIDPYQLLLDAPLLASVDDAEPAVTVEADELPYTGASPGRLTLFAASCLALGALLLMMSRGSASGRSTKLSSWAQSSSRSQSEEQAEVFEVS